MHFYIGVALHCPAATISAVGFLESWCMFRPSVESCLLWKHSATRGALSRVSAKHSTTRHRHNWLVRIVEYIFANAAWSKFYTATNPPAVGFTLAYFAMDWGGKGRGLLDEKEEIMSVFKYT